MRGRERVREGAHQAKVEFGCGLLVPLHDRALNLEEGESNRRLPVLGTFEDEVVERVADLGLSMRQGRGVSSAVAGARFERGCSRSGPRTRPENDTSWRGAPSTGKG